jgi:hypothetical protein
MSDHDGRPFRPDAELESRARRRALVTILGYRGPVDDEGYATEGAGVVDAQTFRWGDAVGTWWSACGGWHGNDTDRDHLDRRKGWRRP